MSSSSSASILSRHLANACSSSFNHFVVEGKLGMTKMHANAKKMVMLPLMMNSLKGKRKTLCQTGFK